MVKMKIARDFRNFLDFSEKEEIFLHGSVVIGDDHECSNIDLLVIFRDKFQTKSKLYPEVGDFLREKGVYISVKFISPEEFYQMQNIHFFSQIKKCRCSSWMIPPFSCLDLGKDSNPFVSYLKIKKKYVDAVGRAYHSMFFVARAVLFQ